MSHSNEADPLTNVYASIEILETQLGKFTHLIRSLDELFTAHGCLLGSQSESDTIAAKEEHEKLFSRLQVIIYSFKEELRSAKADARIVKLTLDESQSAVCSRFVLFKSSLFLTRLNQ